MSTVRVSNEQLEAKKKRMADLRTEIRDLEAIGAEKDSTLWKHLGPKLKASIAANQESLERTLAAGPVRLDEQSQQMVSVDPMADFGACKALGGAIAMAKHILNAVEVDAAVSARREQLKKLEDEVRRINEEQGI